MRSPLSASLPRHRQVASILRNRILSGDFPPKAQLPTELSLIESYKVSRTVVRQAMQALEFEGLITRVAGKGTFVREQVAQAPTGEWSIGSLEDLKSYGLSTRFKILRFAEVAAPAAIAKALHIASGSPVVEVRALRAGASGPLAYLRNYLLLEVGRAVKKVDLTRVTMIDAMERCAGVRLLSATQWFTAVAAGDEEAKVLKVKKGTALLQIQRLFISGDRGPVEFGTTRFRPDRYTHVSELTRHSD